MTSASCVIWRMFRVAPRHTMVLMSTSAEPTMTTVEFLQAACDETWNRHDPDLLAARAAPDAVMRVVPTGEVAHGPEEIARLATRRLDGFPDLHLEVRDAFAADDRLCAQLVLTGTHAGVYLDHEPTHQRMAIELCSVFRLAPDGRVAEETIYFDLASQLRQLGIAAS